MNVSVDVSWKSLNKHGEELCGDKVEVLKTEDAECLILTDGMGSGVKANILATLSAKILGTMFQQGASIELAVETIAKTLPVCQVRGVAYATFSILQIAHDGSAYLAEFDNPSCIFIRDKKVQDYPYKERVIEGKKIREYRFKAQINDCFVLMSDGVIWAGAGEVMNYAWTWDDMAAYTLKCTNETLSASRLATLLSDTCNELYMDRPGDDTTVAVLRVVERKILNIFTGPPKHKEDDERLVREFMAAEGKKVVSGGTSANIVARILKRQIVTTINYDDPSVPPTAHIDGLDLVTEGVVTLGKAMTLLKRYASDEIDVDFFEELDADNGASKLAKMIIEECTEIRLFVGTAQNIAYKNSNLPFELSARMNLVEQLQEVGKQIGKNITVKYY